MLVLGHMSISHSNITAAMRCSSFDSVSLLNSLELLNRFSLQHLPRRCRRGCVH